MAATPLLGETADFFSEIRFRFLILHLTPTIILKFEESLAPLHLIRRRLRGATFSSRRRK
jgi:hypothetical protein